MALRGLTTQPASPPLSPSRPRYWDGDHLLHQQHPRAQAPSEQNGRARRNLSSRHHIKARPPNDAVISSILSSFDALTPPLTVDLEEYCSESRSLRSQQSRAGSPSSPAASRPVVARSITSPGFGMGYGTGVPLVDDGEPSDAAPPPSIRTSRAPSGLSGYTAPSPTTPNDRLRPTLSNPQRSSTSCLRKENANGARGKHSAKTWVSEHAASKESLESTATTKSPRSLRRIASTKTLRSPTAPNFFFQVEISNLREPAQAEQIIVGTPPPVTDGRSKLHPSDHSLREANSKNGSLVEQPLHSKHTATTKTPESETRPQSRNQESASPTPKRPSPKHGLIVDSIPTRTSSLQKVSGSSLSKKKKDKKSKRRTATEAKAEGLQGKGSAAVSDSAWADLGEDDETVRRIRELRERRKSRFEEIKAISTIAGVSTVESDLKAAPTIGSEPVPVPRSEESERASLGRPSASRTLTESESQAFPSTVPEPMPILRSANSKRASLVRPLANRASTEPAIKAHRLLGLREGPHTPARAESTQDLVERTSSNTPEPTRRLQLSREGNGRYSTRPSLDYSPTQTVDMSQDVERRSRSRQSRHVRDLSRGTRRLKRPRSVAAPPEAERSWPLLTTPVAPLRRPLSTRSKLAPHDGWTAADADIPSYQKELPDRRKSMSDARRMRMYDEDVEMPRRDSVAIAVMDFLKAPRLCRKIRHPRTGRVISFSEVGDPEGAAVFVCVGMGLTRYATVFYDELATTLRLRLITVDRPGVGDSEPYPPGDRSGPLSWPEDVQTICEHLGVTKFSLFAHSAGAVYALATALILPQMVNGKVHLLAPWIPPSQLEAVAHPTASASPAGALPRSQRLLRILPASILRAANSTFVTNGSASLKPGSKRQMQQQKQQRELSTSPPATRERADKHRRESLMHMDQCMPTPHSLLNYPIPVTKADSPTPRPNSLVLSATASPMDPGLALASIALNAAEHAAQSRHTEFTSQLTLRTWDLATRDSNPVTDLLVCLERTRDIGFRYTDVNRQVVITHGADDRRVPLANVRWLADQMNVRARANYVESAAFQPLRPPSREGWADPGTSRGGCEVRVLEGEGHGLMASAVVMGDVLTEIAGYWVGQDRGRVRKWSVA